jgi:hypothetical protein
LVCDGAFFEYNSFGGSKLKKIKFKGERKRRKSGLGKNGGNNKIIRDSGVDLEDLAMMNGYYGFLCGISKSICHQKAVFGQKRAKYRIDFSHSKTFGTYYCFERNIAILLSE